MNPVDAYRDKIGMTLLHRLADALKAGEIDRIELAEISTDILENIDKATTNAEILQYLEDLSGRWPFLKEMVTGEKNEATTQQDQAKIQEIGSMLNQVQADAAAQPTIDENNNTQTEQGGVN